MPTDLEYKILQALRHYIAQHGQSPTLECLGKLVGINSKGTVHRYINALIEQGLVERNARDWRGIRLSESTAESLHTLPLLGCIAAGKPIEAIAEQTEFNLAEL